MTTQTLPPTTTPQSSTLTAVRLLDVTKSYDGGPAPVTALRSVSLALRPGSFTAVMGPSGSGKSTLLNTAAGLDTPSSGRVLIGDVDISAMSADRLTRFRREHIGFVFQAYNLINHLTVADNIQLPVRLAGREPDLARQAELVESVGLTGMADRLPSELSGGQAQRVAIARALITSPTVVFADEPTGALDSRTGAQVLDVLRETARRQGQTVVLVTHDPQVASAAERVLFLADGRLVDQLDAPTVEQITGRMVALSR
ncbi:ABC transporter ATP-binding protein [Nocardioides sp.]|uniref:ABC transporter ATP-binding protein n=1 Tax=Nocardioides sp. TaxID=35761 RepID=UPI002EDB70D3